MSLGKHDIAEKVQLILKFFRIFFGGERELLNFVAKSFKDA